MDVGAVIGDRFVIERFAARGGMGEIYRAHDRRTDSPAAIKLMHAGDARLVERFVREARVLRELRHPGIVQYLENGRDARGELYLAMEWLEGEDLATRLAASEISFGESLRLANRVAAALAVAHARRIVHRDLKPSNLFLVDWRIDEVKVLDFGVARLVEGERLTASGEAVGTPGFMAPEQIAGREIDARADVFALGAVLFRCLTGRPAFPGKNGAEVIARIMRGEVGRVRDLAPGLPAVVDDLVARMLAHDPEGRPRDAGRVLAELVALGDGSAATVAAAARLTAAEVHVMTIVTARGDAVAATAAAHGARVERDAGGDVEALFLDGVASDLARRAARCALALRAPAALVTGRGTRATLSDRARRLLDAGGGVRVDEATAGLLDSRFDVRGDRAGLVLHGEREADDAPRSVLGKATPFVGRDREISVLEHVLAECVGEGMARPVLVIGPAGMGKSRLRQELVMQLRARGAPIEIWLGRGDPMRAGAPFALLGDALRRAAGITGAEELATRRALLRARVARAVGEESAQGVAELLGEIAGVAFADEDNPQLRAARRDPQLLDDVTRAAFERFLEAETADRPVLLILEDLHWGDLPSIRHVDAALRALAERPFMVLGLARPEVHASFPRLWADRGLQEMNLGPLSRKAAERLVVHVLPDVDGAALGAVIDGARGHAFFLEELIRHAAEGAGRQAPETVLAMVASRLEGMEPGARRVLRAAAVVGETFWTGAVRALAGDGEVDVWLDLLVEREVLRRGRERSRYAGEQEVRFAHALLREAAYGMLTEDDRARGHHMAGAWLERMGEAEAIVLAEHFERGRDRARAASWYRRAAEQALAGHDLAAAFAHIEAGVTCGAAGAELGELRLLEAIAHRYRGDNAGAERASLEAMRELAPGSKPWSVAAGEAAAASGKLDHGDLLRRIVVELGALPASRRLAGEQAVALARAATQCYARGEHEAGHALLARTDSDGDPGVRGWLEGAHSFAAFVGGRHEEAIVRQRAALDGYQQAGDARNACYARLESAYMLREVGALDEIEAQVIPAVAEADRLGLHSGAKMARALIAVELAEHGRLDEAWPHAREALARSPELTQPRIVCITRWGMGRVLHCAGELGAAEVELRAALAVDRGGDGTPYNVAYGALALLRVAQGDPAEALALARVAEARLDAARLVVPHELVVRLAVVEALLALRREADALAALAFASVRLHATLGTIATPRYRRSFCDDVLVHARILALAGAHGV